MTFIDYVILGILLFSAVAGVVRGFLREVVSVITWVLAFVLAWKFGPSLEPHMAGAVHDSTVRAWAARVPIFLLVLVVGAGIGALLNHFVRLSIFSGLDRLLGLVFGVLRGLVVVGLTAIISQAAHFNQESWWQKSLLVPHTERVANVLRMLVGDERLKRIVPDRDPVPRRGA